MHRNDRPVVLFVDDEQFLLNAYHRMFRHCAWDPLFCRTIEDAYAALEQYQVQVILCDYYLQHSTGAEFFRSLDQKYQDVKRVLLSGSSEHFIEALLTEKLVDQILSKPCTKQQLTQVITEQLASVQSAPQISLS